MEPQFSQINENRSHETDFVVIGSGIGGLCCAALLAKYGYKVTVCESHYLAGGAAHSFEVAGYKFDAGPSFFLGIGGPPGDGSPNPLKQVLDAVGERVESKQYDRWIVYPPPGGGSCFPNIANAAAYERTILQQGGPEALRQWRELDRAMGPLQTAAGLFPAAALRGDLGVALTAARFLGPELLGTAIVAPMLTGPFSALVDKHVSHPWLRSFIDLECFVLSGMTARDTLCAEMAFMFSERNAGRSAIDYPMGGSKAIIDALVRGVEKYGGRLLLRSHVDEILIEGGRAAGVRLRPPAAAPSNGSVIRARCGVVSNASVWDTQRLLPAGAAPAAWERSSTATPALDSFMHLHLGIDATGLDPTLECHHLVVNNWQRITEPQNVIIASVPTVFDPSLAPAGKATVHCYCAANEPYDLWAGLDRRSARYKALKEERAQPLWEALERFIPDIRSRTELTLVGSPLTHERFLRRHRGSYGPGISASGGQSWPGPKTPIPGLSVCGDSCMPGIGVPAAAASGMIAANSLAPVWSHLNMMDELLPASTSA
ncbi:hypothetical protein VOLCADRAFT_64714 [Volvox carteri f. nagariensis]|uniref:Amine oxidase domain-containing protein n=1 Tax=Volvox carteri f. nagariensis TaxID=3068 RepID=D8U6T4_VOLCA|nr:uncharacterized protein VOLCADRAFT_64714 [Volvox carteri f. nagariensis]EFJ44494.1 hypothetical protein VOLCADRAFT_64714 [Volvox carteri f. nagariensis]|eukprot:XP_002954344.1 hypothetical protein VOLCADRAFT_64714 [Volvox carteri f. nagariensis]